MYVYTSSHKYPDTRLYKFAKAASCSEEIYVEVMRLGSLCTTKK